MTAVGTALLHFSNALREREAAHAAAVRTGSPYDEDRYREACRQVETTRRVLNHAREQRDL